MSSLLLPSRDSLDSVFCLDEDEDLSFKGSSSAVVLIPKWKLQRRCDTQPQHHAAPAAAGLGGRGGGHLRLGRSRHQEDEM